MARKDVVITTYIDDLTGEEFSEDEITTVEFSYSGRDFRIDLGPENATKLDDLLAPYIDKAEKVRKSALGVNFNQKQNTGWTSKDVRAFWKENSGKNGLPEFKENGRIFDAVYEAFNKKHPAK